MDKDTQDNIQKLQLLEQNTQGILMQRQQFSTQMIEIDSALKELSLAPEAYKIVGNIMVLTSREELVKDLSEKKELVELRIKNLEKQELQLREKAQAVKDEVMKKLKKE